MNQLDNFLNSDAINDEAMYVPEAHGFITSLVIQPGSLSIEQCLSEIFADDAFDSVIKQAFCELKEGIEKALLNGEFPDLMASDDDSGEDTLTLWATGFMQGVFLHEELWFDAFSEEVAELTLPILSCSELLDDEEMSDISGNEDLLDAMAEQIPNCVIDLYLLFNAPNDT